MQLKTIDGPAPQAAAHTSVPATSPEGNPTSARTSYIGSDVGFARRPPEQRLEMPAQPLATKRSKPEPETDGRWRFLVIFGCSVITTALAAQAMLSGFSAGGINALEWLAVGLFAFNFCYLGIAAFTGAAGTLVLLTTPKPPPLSKKPSGKGSLTAIIIPIYQEKPTKVIAAAEAMWDSLRDIDAEKGFEIFFISDTMDPALVEIEEQAIQDLIRRRPDEPFWYRRRRENSQKKQGNINDFVQRWGGRYEYMLELDADSFVAPEAMLELVRRMDARPRTALIQTLPIIVGARTYSARLQQLALRSHGGLFGAGLSWWSGGAGNFWGHNAIIRLAPFAAHAALPDLPGKEPLGGKILSHDFVEAALLRRAGWRVEIAGDIKGSYEETPPTIVDLAARDRRWAQGNIQQVQILLARGFDWLSKVHIAANLMGYVSGLLWLSFVVCGVLIAANAKFFETETIAATAADPYASVRLVAILALVLTSPKWLSVVLWAFGKLPGWDRSPRFLVNVVCDLGMTMLLAPIVFMNHAGSILSTLMGVDGGWRPQVRDRNGFAWSDLMRHYIQHVIFGALLLLASLAISPTFLLQNLPMGLVLLFAPLIARQVSGVARKGSISWLLYATPEDLKQPAIVRRAEELARRGTTEVRRLAPVRRSRPMQRMGLAVRRAMRRARRTDSFRRTPE
ncbi:MAG: glucans biosynthesis glucosyltransferase MdoH [Hyphomonadaceae bacterium]